MSESASTAKDTNPATPVAAVTSPVATVTAFLDALGRLDTDAAGALLAEDIEYHNVSLPKANGKAAVLKQLGLLTKYCTGFEAINHRIVGEGTTVLTERTDIIEIGRMRSEFWVCGTFEVHNGKITLWRDYFDWANILGSMAKGAGRALVEFVRSKKR
jgi:limonene-1,2-epoxide hydrolase